MKSSNDTESPPLLQAPSSAETPSEPQLMWTDGQGNTVAGSRAATDPASIDLAFAAMERLGSVLDLGALRTVVMVFDKAPIAIAREDGQPGMVTALGRPDEIPGALLAFLRRALTEGRTPS